MSVRLPPVLANPSVCSGFHWRYVALYVALFLAEVLAVVNSAHKLPSGLAPLGPADVALVTGGLDGLGLEMVKQLVLHHNVGRVYVVDVREPAFAFDVRVRFVRCDVGSDAFRPVVEDILAELDRTRKHVSVLVNNAGVRRSGSLLHMPEEDIRRTFLVNTYAHVTALRAVVGHHLASHPTLRLSVVTVSSILGTLGPRNLLVYSASKAAALQIHECLVQELAQHPSIRMLLVTPGQLTTAMFKDVAPSQLFFAPLVNHTALAVEIVARVSRGEAGVLCEPLYASMLPIVKTLPMVVQHWARRFSGMDEKIEAAPARP